MTTTIPVTFPDRVWKLLDHPERWTQGTHVRDSRGWMITDNIRSSEACSWCVLGGVMAVYNERNPHKHDLFDEAYNKLRMEIRDITSCAVREITTWNDNPARTYAEIYETLKKLDI